MGSPQSAPQHIIEDCGPVLKIQGNNDNVTLAKGQSLAGTGCT